MKKIAIVGATGQVGINFLKILEERKFPVGELVCYASKNSAGKKLDFCGEKITVRELAVENIDNDIDIALFSAGNAVSKAFADAFVQKNCIVVDNSSYFRMHADVPLVVPEVNKVDIKLHSGIIANPNCSTIQAVVALNPLKKYKIKRIIYSTYQAVSGAGIKGIEDFYNTQNGIAPEKFSRQIFGNCIPQVDVFEENGYTKEEHKMENETRKILRNDGIKISVTAVRVPVIYGHSESVNVELENPFDLQTVINEMKMQEGLIVKDKDDEFITSVEIAGKDEVFVSRIRRDFSIDNGLNLWVVADNVRKGAATNAIQIAECL